MTCTVAYGVCGVYSTAAAKLQLQYYHVALPDSTTVESNTVAPPAVHVGLHRHGLLLGQAADADPVQARIPPGPTPAGACDVESALNRLHRVSGPASLTLLGQNRT